MNWPVWMNHFFDFWQLPDALITVASTTFAIAAWWKARSVDRQLTGKAKSISPYDPNHEAALVVDLTERKDPVGMITRIRASLREDESLKGLIERIDTAEPLQDYKSIPTSDEGARFILGYYCSPSETGGGPRGRYVTLVCSRPMENNTDDAKEFSTAFFAFLRVVNSRLQSNGVQRLHIFYNGPIPLCALIGTAFANSFDLRLYHHANGKYIFVAEGKPQQLDKRASQNRDKNL